MAEELEKENSSNQTEETEENQVEEETTEETPPEEKETPKEETTETYTDREKRYYARMKSAEESAKKAKEDLAKIREELVKAKLPISDIDAILEVQSSTKDLDPEEIAELKLRASSLGISLSEARKNKNYLVWQKGYREMVAKEKKTLTPSTKQGETEKPMTLVEKLRAAKTREEKEKLLTEAGMYKSPRPRSKSPSTYTTPGSPF